jgi:hypothetical protein
MCKHHFKNSIVCTAINENAMVGEGVCTAINENAMVGEDDFSNSEEELNNLVVASTLDISVIEASHDLTIMDINDLPFGIIQEGKTLQIPAFFENVIPRPVGSFLLPGSSTLKRIWCLIQKQKNLVFQGSILNFSSSSASFFIPVYPRAAFNRRKK